MMSNKNIFRQNQQNFYLQNNAVCIDWPIPSLDMPTIEHVEDFLTVCLTHNSGTKKPLGPQCDFTGGIEADPWVPNHQNYS